VGTNDLCSERVRTGKHATHFLLTRDYALLPLPDGKDGPFSTAYHHWYCDDELVVTAEAYGAIAFATNSIVEHFHPQAGKAEDDPIYRKGRSRQRADRRVFQTRNRAIKTKWTHKS
jgi:hypothetical protein